MILMIVILVIAFISPLPTILLGILCALFDGKE